MIINTGLYSENHFTEPARASLIQNSLNGKYTSLEEEWQEAGNIFSFDLHSGGGGVIHALQIIDGFTQTDEIENGLIVSGDVKPLRDSRESLQFQNGAAAILVSKIPGKKGFVHFRTETFTEYKDDVKSTTNWDTGKFRFITNQNINYLNHCLECTLQTVKTFFTEQNLSWEDFDLVFTSQIPKGFASLLRNNINMEKKFIQINNEYVGYTAGLIFSLARIFNTSEFTNARNILFITVGSGITVSLAHYRNNE
jgi:3-oxoacyl-[acyl-carrier-protein] synthase III